LGSPPLGFPRRAWFLTDLTAKTFLRARQGFFINGSFSKSYDALTFHIWQDLCRDEGDQRLNLYPIDSQCDAKRDEVLWRMNVMSETFARYAFWPMMYALRPVALRKTGINQAINTNL
jgi:hypothetical protein